MTNYLLIKLTYFNQIDFSILINLAHQFQTLGLLGDTLGLANSKDPDQKLHSVAFIPDHHCLLCTIKKMLGWVVVLFLWCANMFCGYSCAKI